MEDLLRALYEFLPVLILAGVAVYLMAGVFVAFRGTVIVTREAAQEGLGSPVVITLASLITFFVALFFIPCLLGGEPIRVRWPMPKGPEAGDVVKATWKDGSESLAYQFKGRWFRWDHETQVWTENAAPRIWVEIEEREGAKTE